MKTTLIVALLLCLSAMPAAARHRHYVGAQSYHHGAVWRPVYVYHRGDRWSDNFFGGGPYTAGSRFYGEIGTMHYGD